MEDIDIYRSAKLYIDQYGEDASVKAAMRAEAMFRADDLAGYAVWMRIGQAIEDLQVKKGKTRH